MVMEPFMEASEGNSGRNTETNEQTIHLALPAYCDATELDSSDPTLWYKLACAARLLGREVDNNNIVSLGEEGSRRTKEKKVKK